MDLSLLICSPNLGAGVLTRELRFSSCCVKTQPSCVLAYPEAAERDTGEPSGVAAAPVVSGAHAARFLQTHCLSFSGGACPQGMDGGSEPQAQLAEEKPWV